ncbi:MAG: mercuric reductase [Myxococcota bacterium]|nr:mercuric reductase [Myxococcota bacterium]
MTDWPELTPLDAHNDTLTRNVCPEDWVNPTPQGRYNLVVIGAGAAGLITSAVAAGLGARVALVEGHHLGGDCLNVGCVPSKSVIRAARMVAEARRAAEELGLPLAADAVPDFSRVMERMRRIRAQISAEDAATRYRDELGVDVYRGHARFTDSGTVAVGDQELRFRKAVIATGARATRPRIPGLEEAGYRTNEDIFHLTDRPERLGVIGAGPIGCELAQAFQRLGCKVTLLHADGHLLPRENPEAAAIVAARFAREGVRVVDACEIQAAERRADGRAIRFRHADGREETLLCDEILVGVGRAPNVADLGLEHVDVAFDAHEGIQVDDYLRTTNHRIFAAGDACMRWKFTHAADAAAKLVVRNALFLPTAKVSNLVMPWCTYTDPEIAHVGMYPDEAQARGVDLDAFRVPLSEVNRAVTDGEAEGFVEVYTEKGKDRIAGATIVSSHAGEMISEVTLAMTQGIGLGKLLDVIHPYPTQAEGIKRAAGAWVRTRLTPFTAGALRRWMALQR